MIGDWRFRIQELEIGLDSRIRWGDDLGSELTHHLGYPPGGIKPDETTNHRNGSSGKTVLADDGALAIEVPRDREGTFEPRLIAKHERRFTGFDDKILALYARGMTVREIQGFLADMYGVEVSPDLISTVTDGIVAEVTAWQSRPLEPIYPMVFFDALRVKIRDDATVRWKERKTVAKALRPISAAGSAEAAGGCA
jgi:transposase-like protein